MLDGPPVEPLAPTPQAPPAEKPAVVVKPQTEESKTAEPAKTEKKADTTLSAEDQKKMEEKAALEQAAKEQQENVRLVAMLGDLKNVGAGESRLLLDRAAGLSAEGYVNGKIKKLEFDAVEKTVTPKQYEDDKKHIDNMREKLALSAKNLDIVKERAINDSSTSKEQKALACDIDKHLLQQRIDAIDKRLADPNVDLEQRDRLERLRDDYKKSQDQVEKQKRAVLGLKEGEESSVDIASTLAVGAAEAAGGKKLSNQEKLAIVKKPVANLEAVFQQASREYAEGKTERVDNIVQFVRDNGFITDPKELQKFKDNLTGKSLEDQTKGSERIATATSWTKAIMALGGLLGFLAIKQGSGEKEGQGGGMM